MRYTLGDYTLDTQRYTLSHTGIPLKLQPKVFDLLAYLIQHRDRVVTRQELFDTLWPAQRIKIRLYVKYQEQRERQAEQGQFRF